MNPKIICLLAAFSFTLNSAALAAGAKTYQATGTILEVTPTKVALQTATGRFEIDLDPTTKLVGELKVGGKVTITYAMSAMKVEATTSAAAPVGIPDAQKKEVPQSPPSPAPTQ